MLIFSFTHYIKTNKKVEMSLITVISPSLLRYFLSHVQLYHHFLCKWNLWKQRLDSNQRFPTYEDGEMTNFSTLRYFLLAGDEGFEPPNVRTKT